MSHYYSRNQVKREDWRAKHKRPHYDEELLAFKPKFGRSVLGLTDRKFLQWKALLSGESKMAADDMDAPKWSEEEEQQAFREQLSDSADAALDPDREQMMEEATATPASFHERLDNQDEAPAEDQLHVEDITDEDVA